MSPDKTDVREKPKKTDDFVVFDSVKEAIEAGMDEDMIFHQWTKQNSTSICLMNQKMAELLEVWQGFDLPVTVMLFYLRGFQNYIIEQLRKTLPPEALPDLEKALEEIDLLAQINNSNTESKMKSLQEVLKAQSKKAPAFDPMCR